MTSLSIRYAAALTREECCLCGRDTIPGAGPQLCLADREAAVCHCCGQKHAPHWRHWCAWRK